MAGHGVSMTVMGRNLLTLERRQRLAHKLAGCTVLIGEGPSCKHAGLTRAGIMRIVGESASLIWEGHVENGTIDEVSHELQRTAREVWIGGLDLSYTSPCSLGWTCPPAPFRLFSRWRGLLCSIDDGAVKLVPPWSLRSPAPSATTFPADDVRHVRVSVNEFWTVRGVELILKDSTARVVARDHSIVPVIDIVYDGLELSHDAAWAQSLGRALASALGVKLKSDEDLGGAEWSPPNSGNH